MVKNFKHYFAERKYGEGFPEVTIDLGPISCVDDKFKIWQLLDDAKQKVLYSTAARWEHAISSSGKITLDDLILGASA